jgi:hypothetical protein
VVSTHTVMFHTESSAFSPQFLYAFLMNLTIKSYLPILRSPIGLSNSVRYQLNIMHIPFSLQMVKIHFILSSHLHIGCPSVYFSSPLPTKMAYAFIFSLISPQCPAASHFPSFDHPNNIREAYRS